MALIIVPVHRRQYLKVVGQEKAGHHWISLDAPQVRMANIAPGDLRKI